MLLLFLLAFLLLLLLLYFPFIESINECFGGGWVRSWCGVGCLHKFGGLFGGGSAKSPGSSSPVSVIEMSLENSFICFLIASCRLELSLVA